jgi:MoxR-like ATPase
MNVDEAREKLAAIRAEVGKIVVGLEDAIDLLLVAMLSGGHVLLEGPPGIGKTTLAKTFAQSIGGSFKRIQMTPDLLPADVLGVNVYNQRDGSWSLRRGPIFCNLVLVDELNRASPKVQSAFLEVMQERQVTIEGETLGLGEPFMVLATQVPYAGTGTYLLTDVQIDRFGYKLDLYYPEDAVELQVLEEIDRIDEANTDAVVSPEDVVALGDAAKGIYVHSRVKRYVVGLVMWLRGNPNVLMGPSTRASIWLLKGSRALALMRGREYVIPDDVKYLSMSVLSHRVELTSMSRAENVTVRSLVEEALKAVPVPKNIAPGKG